MPARIPTASAKKAAIDIAYQLFTNKRDYPLEGRRAVVERVCLLLMRSCDEVALREFFLDHIGEIMATVEAPLTRVYTVKEVLYNGYLSPGEKFLPLGLGGENLTVEILREFNL